MSICIWFTLRIGGCKGSLVNIQHELERFRAIQLKATWQRTAKAEIIAQSPVGILYWLISCLASKVVGWLVS